MFKHSCHATLMLGVMLLTAAPALAQLEGMRVEISLSEREAYIFIDDEIVRTEPVAIGQSGHETPTGEWEIFQIDWNPDWTPPDSDWADGYDRKPPGHPDNPMGRVRIMFDPPITIHGTDEQDSLGEAASHGSIRMGNEAAIEVAQMVMDHGGADKPDGWVDDVLATPDRMEEVILPEPVPIYVME